MKHHFATPSAFEGMADQIGQLLEDMKQRPFYQFSSGQGWHPSLNLYERDHDYVVCVDLAHIDIQQVRVVASGRHIHITGRRCDPALPGAMTEGCDQSLQASDCTVHMMEIDSGHFSRTIDVQHALCCDSVKTDFADGFLWVLVSKDPATSE